MRVTATNIPDVLLIEPKVFGDERGFFYESFNQQAFEQATGPAFSFVQDNHSQSSRGVLRGLHYQLPPHAQGKLVRCTSGAVWDVALDIRRKSRSFGQWVGVELSDTNHRQLWIPPGFAHGFIVLSERADFLYKTTAYYAPEYERCIQWDDTEINITWPIAKDLIQLSAKDAEAQLFNSAEVF